MMTVQRFTVYFTFFTIHFFYYSKEGLASSTTKEHSKRKLIVPPSECTPGTSN